MNTTTVPVGPVTVTCSVAESPFITQTQATVATTDGLFDLVVRFSSPLPATLPPVALTWSHPMTSCHLKWNTAIEGVSSIVPWKRAASLAARTTSNAPVTSICSMDGTNRLTFAISDALNSSVLRAQLVEETAEISCTVELLNNSKVDRTDHSVTLRIDTRAVPYSEALNDVSVWWAGLAGYEPLAVPDDARRPVYCSWYSHHQSISDEIIEAECRLARTLGMDSIIVDDGWQTDDTNRGYAYCGDWEVTPSKFADFEGHVRRVQNLGLKYILWFSVPFVGKHTRAYARFKDRLLPRAPDADFWALDPRYPDVRRYLADTFRTFVTKYGLDGLKLDFIDQFDEPVDEPAVVPEGRDNMSVAEAAAKLLSEVADTLRAVNPQIMLEFRQPYTGPFMRRCGNMFRVGDVPNDFRSNRVNSIDLRLLSGATAVHSDPIMWHPDDPVPSAALQLWNTLFAVPQISVALGSLSDEHRAMLATYLSFWRRHRKLLLDGALSPLEPGSGYSQVHCRNDETFLAAIYASTPVSLPADLPPEIILVNATMANRIWLDAEDHEGSVYSARVADCTGLTIEGSHDITLRDTQTLSVPAAGTMTLVRKRR